MSTRGFSVAVPCSAGGLVPFSGDVNFYLDVTIGSDADDGHDWTHAFRTWAKAMNAVEQVLETNPETVNITIWVTNTTGAAINPGGFTISPCLPDRCRLHVVCPTDKWCLIGAGLVTINGITLEAGSSLARVVVGGALVPAATDIGMTLRITSGAELLIATILNVNVGNKAYTISMLHADVPAWADLTGNEIAEVIEPSNVLNGTLTFAPTAARAVSATITDSKNWLFGVRANYITVTGEQCAAAACTCKSQPGVVPDGDLYLTSPRGVAGLYILDTAGVDRWVSETRARSWGCFGATPAGQQGQIVGNSAVSAMIDGFNDNYLAGYFQTSVSCSHGIMQARKIRATTFVAQSSAYIYLTNFRAQGDGTNACMLAKDEGSEIKYGQVYIEQFNTGQRAVDEATEGAQIYVEDEHIAIEAAAPANYPIRGHYAYGGTIVLTQFCDDLMTQYHYIHADRAGRVRQYGDLGFASPRPGGNHGGTLNTNILIENGSRMVVPGAAKLSNVPNTAPSGFLSVEGGSVFEAPLCTLGLGNAPADWTNGVGSYGDLGVIHIADGSTVKIGGAITDTAVGAGAGIAIQCRRASSFWYGANGQITGGATTKVGIKAAAAFPAAAVLNDLTTGAQGVSATEELCVVGLQPAVGNP